MRRLTAKDYAVDAGRRQRRLSARGFAVGWRMEPSFGGASRRRRRPAARIHIGIAYASKRDQKRKWRFMLNRAST